MHQRIKYDVLSQKELEYMKGRLEQILIERGVHLDHEEMLKALEEKGCIVDMEARDVRFTKELIDKACRLVEGLGLHYRLSKLAAGDCSASMATSRFSLERNQRSILVRS